MLTVHRNFSRRLALLCLGFFALLQVIIGIGLILAQPPLKTTDYNPTAEKLAFLRNNSDVPHFTSSPYRSFVLSQKILEIKNNEVQRR